MALGAGAPTIPPAILSAAWCEARYGCDARLLRNDDPADGEVVETDLNGDGKADYLLTQDELCDPGGCPVQVYVSEAAGFRLVLSESAWPARVLAESVNGYRVLCIRSRPSAGNAKPPLSGRRYQWTGERYEASGFCALHLPARPRHPKDKTR